ncbi:MAG: MBL fold metallo-hydrolase [Thermodesulfobacteriaceae bacterium]|nr:MBL fold metallo-hydrolase [Thermodesulfobacteriaceae bacterium]MCX8041360.1 MBL fold metallo-hydrolase [Thermodesulfobacteriaceae bacterium]MDW8135634.1 MBL fold metallo-hydrolase [Thermodesulfobacterium sp.]
MSELLFLGTAGARYVVAKQLRASGGVLLKIEDQFLLLDPGPGTLVYLAKNKIPLEKIKVILVSHQHLDHCADLNIVVDAITEGGFKKRGILYLTESAFKEPILLSYLHPFLLKIEFLKPKTLYEEPPFKFKTTSELKHSVETYGFLVFLPENKILGFLSDTAYFEELVEEFREAQILVVNLVREKSLNGVLHLSVSEVKKLLQKIKPETVILTHFGMTMLKANPFKIAKKLSEDLKIHVIAAYDGMKFMII